MNDVPSKCRTQTVRSHKGSPHFHIDKLQSSSSRSPQKENRRRSKKRLDEHVIAVEFKETSDDYKRHLYTTTTVQITKTLEDLLHQLHESTLQDVPSGKPNDLSPLKLSKPAQYERMAATLYQPLSAYRLGLTRTNTDGEKIRVESTLANRMDNFDEHIHQQTAELTKLQTEWEMIVGEIFKLGVTCLGDGAMETLLSASEDTLSPSKTTDTTAESTLFVPEHDTPPPRKKKCVTFQTTFPPFLYQASRFKKAAPETPRLLGEEVRELEAQVGNLGQEHLKDFCKIEDRHAAWLKKKHVLIAQAMLKED
ncbi:hypothetical protein P153DRAFT_59785 [Dothidotthia symphoricarpi CBS 119687]|uniref:Uncharacterized protein n=1 Tax=Dothidotthia symphoricarpi CBS 119687 TaxID=1392245 RepID=A0A6A6A7I9_9PLEO|nr:uncharacterized protein P153DRAFT_59785 [Dothidotthia symphoricarpi CBS 119687]KAF2127113.1 hypothetical protein P153DRAFT_59785 [Dothidotthia symphoricarpi CBS 119687]